MAEVGNVVNVYIWLLSLASWASYERLEVGTTEDSKIPAESWGITGLWQDCLYTNQKQGDNIRVPTTGYIPLKCRLDMFISMVVATHISITMHMFKYSVITTSLSK